MITEQNEETTIPFTPGRLLREGRIEAGFSEQDVADSLNLKLDIVRAIESNDFTKIAAPTFAKGYLRAYSKLIGVDDALAVELYNQMGLDKANQSAGMKSFSMRTKRESNDSKLMLVSYIIIIIVIGMAVVWWWQQKPQASNALVEQDSLAQTQPVASPPTNVENLGLQETPQVVTQIQESDTLEKPNAVEAEPITSENELETNNEGDTEAVSKEETSLVTQVQQKVEEVEEAENNIVSTKLVDSPTSDIVMTFNQDCWIEIIDSQGEKIAYGVKTAGRVMPVSGFKPFKVTVCAPEKVAVEFESQSIDMNKFKQGMVARFELPLEN
ncbi:RodZ domain-containing protein [Catenovulum maritimum]|uniref:Cytoskeleton protein RodZ-like C-terminal domain-containing protein n=1 Tax=Catenovulum maritimum TaxID=1513271 RepID=A0A0J8GPQ3_9ALTE|nr:RodZ domain-containing protein [Catenovulum maritimum]KMT64785.1 hypothetical protein XM47_13075 [Catenovulum maritimum]